MKLRTVAVLAALLIAAPALAAVLAPAAAASPVVPGLTVSTLRIYKDTSFILTDSIFVQSGGVLILDNVSVQFRFQVEGSRQIRVLPGGELHIVNGSRIYSQFQSTAFSLHYLMFIEPGGHFVLQNSTLDYPYSVGIGDQNAVLDNSTISHALLGLYGYNLTLSRMTIFSTNVGIWVSGHSLVSNSTFESAVVYHAILDGTSRIETSRFNAADTADIALMENASAYDNVHRGSVRAAIVNQNATVVRADISGMTAGGIQIGAEDFRYGCGIYVSFPANERLNLRQFNFYQRWNNSITLEDISIRDTPAAITFGREVWREALQVPQLDNCVSDPPAQEAWAPLTNTITMRVTRDQAFETLDTVFNGSLTVDPGATFTVRGANWRFLSPGSLPQVHVNGSLVLERTRMTSGLVDYPRDQVNESQAVAPPYDLRIDTGSIAVRNSTLLHLGSTASASTDAGIVVRSGAGPVDILNSAVNQSLRGVTLGCCASPVPLTLRLTVEAATMSTSGPALALYGGTARIFNSTISASATAAVQALGTDGELHLYSTIANPQGPGTVSIFRYGFVQVRAVWEDLRPAAGAPINVSDFPANTLLVTLYAGRDGWVAPQFLLWRTTTWDGAGEQGQSPSLFTFSATAGGATARTLPLDISLGAIITLALPDERPPAVSLNMPEIFYTNVSGGVVTGVAEDFETGITIVELSLDGGPFLSVLQPTAPQNGQINFSFTLAGLTEAVHVLLVRAWDSVGNTAEAGAYFVVDQTVPQVADFDFNIETNRRDLNLTGKLSEPGWVTVNGNTTNASLLDGSFAFRLVLDTDSEYVLLSVLDFAGNGHDYPFIVTYDGVPPPLAITSPQDGSWTTQSNITIKGTIEFNAELSLNGVPLTVSGTSNFEIRAALTEGENLLTLSARDRAGNAMSVSLTVYLDAIPPILDVLGPDALHTLASPNVTLRLRTEAGITITVLNQTYTAASERVEIPLHLNEGRNLLSIEVTDAAGNQVLRGLALTVDTTRPTITFAHGSSDDSENVTYFLRGLTEPNAVVTIGGYTSQADGQGVFSVPLHLRAGANVIPVTARDSAGNSANATFTVTFPQPALAGDPGLAPPSGMSLLLLLIGAAAVVALPLAARWAATRKRPPPPPSAPSYRGEYRDVGSAADTIGVGDEFTVYRDEDGTGRV